MVMGALAESNYFSCLSGLYLEMLTIITQIILPPIPFS
jgi:hypothetical protein